MVGGPPYRVGSIHLAHARPSRLEGMTLTLCRHDPYFFDAPFRPLQGGRPARPSRLEGVTLTLCRHDPYFFDAPFGPLPGARPRGPLFLPGLPR